MFKYLFLFFIFIPLVYANWTPGFVEPNINIMEKKARREYHCPDDQKLETFLIEKSKQLETRLKTKYLREMQAVSKPQGDEIKVGYQQLPHIQVDTDSFQKLSRNSQRDLLIMSLGDMYHVIVHILTEQGRLHEAMYYNLKSMEYQLLNKFGSKTSYQGILHAFDHFDLLLVRGSENDYLNDPKIKVLDLKFNPFQLRRLDQQHRALTCESHIRRPSQREVTDQSYKFINKVLKRSEVP